MKNNKSVLLSIIIPIYNTKQYLSICLDSILSMELEDDEIEIILVDDGSIDGCSEVCQQYQKTYSSVKTICQKNKGPAAARNSGLDLATGDYVAFFDSDDYVSTRELKNILVLIKKLPGADFLVSDFHRIANSGLVLDKVFQINNTVEPIQEKQYLKRFLQKRGCVWNVWRYIFNRNFLLKNDMRFVETVSCAEDLEYVVRILSKTEFPCFLHNPYYYYRVNYGNTLTRRYTVKRISELLEMLQRSVAYLRKNPTEITQYLLNKITWEYIFNIALIEEVPASERPEARKLFLDTAFILNSSSQVGVKICKALLSLLGIDILAKILYLLKRGKREIRKIKTIFKSRSKGSFL